MVRLLVEREAVMRRFVSLVLGLAAMAAAQPASADICAQWAPPEKVGTLDTSVVNEASGIGVSRQFPGRLYFNNDSGDGPFFYITDMAGAGTRKIAVTGFTPQDVEELALGPCGPATCLYLGDIGDNANRRETVSFVVLNEKRAFADSETPLRTVNARYPDGPRDAESFAIHPNGDLYVVTKPRDVVERRAGVAQVYRLTAGQLAISDGSVQVFEKVGSIDLPYLLYFNGLAGQIATGMDISEDGSRFMLITYQSAMEVNFDLSKPLPPSRGWRMNTDYRTLQLAPLPQAEAIAYTADGTGFFYTTEKVDAQYVPTAPQPVDLAGAAPIYREACAR